MPSERLALALRELQPGDWQLFERFAAEFLAVEFPSLRTMASPSGDRGRDGELVRPDEDVTTMVQYSVTKDWSGKIRGTVRTLKENFGGKVKRLIYTTNQTIGPDADSLVEELRRAGVQVDVRDSSYFVARELRYPQLQEASRELCTRVVDPLLASRGVGERTGAVLNDDEQRVALLHLTLEGYDATSNKGLTRSCFESLVLASLHDTRTDRTKTQEDVRSDVSALLPAGDRAQVTAQADGALNRLSVRGGPVKRVGKSDDYHLAFAEQQRMQDSVARFLGQSAALEDEIAKALDRLGLELPEDVSAETVEALRTGIESVLLRRGEAFAVAAINGQVSQLDAQEVLGLLAGVGTPLKHLSDEAAAEIILAILEDPSPTTRHHLRALADGYTLFAFMRQTPDVQKVVLSVFAEGEVWLDATVVLPLVAETLLEDAGERHYTTLLQAARDAGFRLFVTDGVVEEVERHLNRCLSFARTTPSEWAGNVPFVYAAYALAGRGRGSFFDWLEEFRGQHTPEEDIKEYLDEVFGIAARSLYDVAGQANPDLRDAVREVWAAGHDQRRSPSDSDLTPESTLRLINHDVENTVGVMQLRKTTPSSPMGYRQWFLTLDRVAFDLSRLLSERIDGPVPASPALSPDFLTELLRLGPLRADVEREHHVDLPVVTAISRFEALPRELIELADDVRKRFAEQNERVIRRRVKDALNEARWRPGSAARGGVKAAEDRIRARLRSQKARGAL